jgi:tetratricopeptide (TPR) repeat protein
MRLRMATSVEYPTVHFPDDFDERAEFEMTSRGYLSRATVELADGSEYEVYFTDPVRLAQSLEDDARAGRPYYAEPNLIVLEEVTRPAIEEAVRGLWESGYFGHLKPLRAADGLHPDAEEAHQRIVSGLREGLWSEVEELLREHGHLFAPDRVASWRGRCYRGLGQPETALFYFDEATRLSPD